MAARRLALIDCNNFYVSCEQAFNPALRNRPVVVLSNNDGCVVSRSAEAKQAGIPMGAPYFQVRKQLADIHGAVLSSNYVLYADMSRRAMRLIAEQFPEQEIYSIDECFIDMTGLSDDQALIQAFRLKQHLLQCLSLPVSIGIGSTKTLAKLAASLAKRPGASGVANFSTPMSPERLAEMRAQPVGEIWGIGRRTSQSLEAAQVITVGDLLDKPVSWIRKRYSVTLLRTVEELKGQDQLGLQGDAPPRQQIIASRSFGNPITTLAELGEALATFVARAAERLRADRSLASIMRIYYHAKDQADGAPCTDSMTLALPHASDDTRLLVRQALAGMAHLYHAGLKYKKAGVILGGISSADIRQPGLTGLYPEAAAPSPVMKLMDQVNQRYGRDTVRLASMGVDAKAAWHMSCSRRSRRYTTALDELPILSIHGMS